MATLVPGTRLGNFPYEIAKVLDENPGNMSQVCLATVRDERTGMESQVVIKLSLGTQEEHKETYEKTLENEVECLRQLKHPGIVRIFPIYYPTLRALPYVAKATALAGNPLFTVVEHLSGGSLTNLIADGVIDIGMALEIARSLAVTLDYLHCQRQVHMDLKPDNVLFRVPPAPGEPVEPVLIDFGIAAAIGQAGLRALTLQYAAPERVESARQPHLSSDPAARPHPSMDVYALGVILYEMLTGQPPFRGRTRRSLTASILEGRPKAPSKHHPSVNPDLDQFVLKMLAKDPEMRPAAKEVAIQLEALSIQGNYQPRYPDRMAAPVKLSAVNRYSRTLPWITIAISIVAFLQLLLLWGTYPLWRDALFSNLAGLR